MLPIPRRKFYKGDLIRRKSDGLRGKVMRLDESDDEEDDDDITDEDEFGGRPPADHVHVWFVNDTELTTEQDDVELVDRQLVVGYLVELLTSPQDDALGGIVIDVTQDLDIRIPPEATSTIPKEVPRYFPENDNEDVHCGDLRPCVYLRGLTYRHLSARPPLLPPVGSQPPPQRTCRLAQGDGVGESCESGRESSGSVERQGTGCHLSETDLLNMMEPSVILPVYNTKDYVVSRSGWLGYVDEVLIDYTIKLEGGYVFTLFHEAVDEQICKMGGGPGRRLFPTRKVFTAGHWIEKFRQKLREDGVPENELNTANLGRGTVTGGHVTYIVRWVACGSQEHKVMCRSKVPAGEVIPLWEASFSLGDPLFVRSDQILQLAERHPQRSPDKHSPASTTKDQVTTAQETMPPTESSSPPHSNPLLASPTETAKRPAPTDSPPRHSVADASDMKRPVINPAANYVMGVVVKSVTKATILWQNGSISTHSACELGPANNIFLRPYNVVQQTFADGKGINETVKDSDLFVSVPADGTQTVDALGRPCWDYFSTEMPATGTCMPEEMYDGESDWVDDEGIDEDGEGPVRSHGEGQSMSVDFRVEVSSGDAAHQHPPGTAVPSPHHGTHGRRRSQRGRRSTDGGRLQNAAGQGASTDTQPIARNVPPAGTNGSTDVANNTNSSGQSDDRMHGDTPLSGAGEASVHPQLPSPTNLHPQSGFTLASQSPASCRRVTVFRSANPRVMTTGRVNVSGGGAVRPAAGAEALMSPISTVRPVRLGQLPIIRRPQPKSTGVSGGGTIGGGDVSQSPLEGCDGVMCPSEERYVNQVGVVMKYENSGHVTTAWVKDLNGLMDHLKSDRQRRHVAMLKASVTEKGAEGTGERGERSGRVGMDSDGDAEMNGHDGVKCETTIDKDRRIPLVQIESELMQCESASEADKRNNLGALVCSDLKQLFTSVQESMAKVPHFFNIQRQLATQVRIVPSWSFTQPIAILHSPLPRHRVLWHTGAPLDYGPPSEGRDKPQVNRIYVPDGNPFVSVSHECVDMGALPFVTVLASVGLSVWVRTLDGRVAEMTVDELKPLHVMSFMDEDSDDDEDTSDEDDDEEENAMGGMQNGSDGGYSSDSTCASLHS
eukprot:GHVN01058161.1.p1 GENE.GHVN01058161.1~~GHVN01058161.1.p1  ORF type:complete len:1155 (+),score=265.57 GHVN01058161.1:106-3465(+)